MEVRLADNLKTVLFLIVLLSPGSSENDLYFNFCGTWRHGNAPLRLEVELTPGCRGLSFTANESVLSVRGRLTAECNTDKVIELHEFGLHPEKNVDFCVYWEPFLDQFKMEVGGRNLTLCYPAVPLDSCCTDLSDGPNAPAGTFGIVNAMIWDDVITTETRTAFQFIAGATGCKSLCDQADQDYLRSLQSSPRPPSGPPGPGLPCGHRSTMEMEDGFGGYNVSSLARSGSGSGSGSGSAVRVFVPPALRRSSNSSKVVFTFFNGNPLFQDGHQNLQLLQDVVDITVENQVVTNLSEPVKIGFHHNAIPDQNRRSCVSWDVHRDPLQVRWLADGCTTLARDDAHTECLCDHLTYFAVLVDLEPRPLRHLLALTCISLAGCAVSFVSCVALLVFLARKWRRSTNNSLHNSLPVHVGLAASLALLSLLFFLTGVLANAGHEAACTWAAPLLHYALLSAFVCMGVEVFHAFWITYKPCIPFPRPYDWILAGFVLPVIPVGVLVAVGDVYGLREVEQAATRDPYLMCWMKVNPKARLAHYFTNLTLLAVLVLAGSVVLVFVYRKIRNRAEWSQNRGTVFMLGLILLFGTSWGLAFLDFGPLSNVVLFLFCFLNSFQGFFLMIGFWLQGWMKRRLDRGSSSTTTSTSTSTSTSTMLPTANKHTLSQTPQT
ncbi:adhesion G-protein coupled receptor G1-like [Cololabis saira]|uniref:adhesion G-protein coupled receptor G1-like n=1 Tax=Cololabis saira TaxID=129043 RepID=UPI002AD422A2|nr:adhesion G-protein coupled receptor G1-like [Cololabis saira]